MNKILYDLTAGQESLEAKFHGGGEYANYIFKRILELGYYSVECIYNSTLYIDIELIEIIKERGIVLYDIAGDRLQVQRLLSTNSYSKFYSALPKEWYADLDFSKVQFVYTIHGLRGLEMPNDRFEFKYLDSRIQKLKTIIKYFFFPSRRFDIEYSIFLRLISIKNSFIYTVSNHSKWSILSFYPFLSQDKIQVSHAPLYFMNDDSIEECTIPGEDFYLIMSSNRWIKNSYRACKALDNLFSKGLIKEKKVVLVGANRAVSNFNLKNRDKFIFKEYVNKEHLNFLLRECFCLIYPTLNEGFGYPPLQAMKYSTPSICSAISSIQEVCRDAVLYFNPFSISEIENRILRFTLDHKLQNELKLKMDTRLKELISIQVVHEKSFVEMLFG